MHHHSTGSLLAMSIAGRTRPLAPRQNHGLYGSHGCPPYAAGGHAELPGDGETGADVLPLPVEAHVVFGRGGEAVMGVEGRG